MRDNNGCVIVYFIGFAILLMFTFPKVMIPIVIGIVIIWFISHYISKYKFEKEREEYLKREEQRIAKEKIVRERAERQEREKQEKLKREKEEQQRLEELKYETIEVVFPYIDKSEKPCAAVKRSNNTYEFVEREKTPFTIGEVIKILKEKTNTWNWIDEQEYQKEKVERQQRVRQFEIEKREKQSQEKIIGTRWLVTQSIADLKDNIFEFCQNGVLKYGDTTSKWELKEGQIIISHNNGYAILTGQIKDNIISGTAYNIKGTKWTFSGKQVFNSLSEKSNQQEDFVSAQTHEKKVQYLDNFGINYLYHITHKNNLENILQIGLKSHNDARRNNLMQNDIANNDVNDRRCRIEPIHSRSLHDYVPLYFNPKNPMLYVQNMQDNIVILAIDKMLIYNKDTIFTDGNAANRPTEFFNVTNKLTQLNWECIKAEYWSGFKDGKRERMAEILVFPNIPAKYIQKIYCNNPDTLQYIQEKTKNYKNIRTELNSNLFF